MYFLLFRIFEQLALALKNKVALEFLTVFKYFLLFRIFDQVALVLKTELAFKFPNPGGGRSPRPPASYAYGYTGRAGASSTWDKWRCVREEDLKVNLR